MVGSQYTCRAPVVDAVADLITCDMVLFSVTVQSCPWVLDSELRCRGAREGTLSRW